MYFTDFTFKMTNRKQLHELYKCIRLIDLADINKFHIC